MRCVRRLLESGSSQEEDAELLVHEQRQQPLGQPPPGLHLALPLLDPIGSDDDEGQEGPRQQLQQGSEEVAEGAQHASGSRQLPERRRKMGRYAQEGWAVGSDLEDNEVEEEKEIAASSSSSGSSSSEEDREDDSPPPPPPPKRRGRPPKQQLAAVAAAAAAAAAQPEKKRRGRPPKQRLEQQQQQQPRPQQEAEVWEGEGTPKRRKRATQLPQHPQFVLQQQQPSAEAVAAAAADAGVAAAAAEEARRAEEARVEQEALHAEVQAAHVAEAFRPPSPPSVGNAPSEYPAAPASPSQQPGHQSRWVCPALSALPMVLGWPAGGLPGASAC
jgi:hypothetical protein